MPAGKKLSTDLKTRIINLFESSVKQIDISAGLSVHRSIVSRTIQKFQTVGGPKN